MPAHNHAPIPLDNDKTALTASQAGMRLIAQLTLVNNGNHDRLRQFIRESYTTDALAEQDADTRFDHLQAQFALLGRQKFKQALAVAKHHVIVVLQAEHRPEFYYCELKCEDDYPHKITSFMHTQLEEAE